MTGLFTLVPLVGRSIIYIAIAGTLAVQAATVDPRLLWFPIAFLAVMIVAFDNLVRTYIRPYLSGRLLNTGLVMFAYLFGPPLFGWYGIFLGPFLMVFIVTFVRMILPVLADPECERVELNPEHTLDEYAENVGDQQNVPRPRWIGPTSERGEIYPHKVSSPLVSAPVTHFSTDVRRVTPW
ncbi:AI-2E family transporter [Natrinema salsiterrestre]|uniref:AI-2E family transporter n=1 Tax=Natrinema salsiterrestre TaxID=2950540 RepID=A0A9Q4Q2D9_9EURY|nr:hypothetical protein [Natrinema salsiterrestre]MDF9748214.1 hypothetical protein [Natrinema salsiterrestre]